ncbi:MAG: hypothetical protein WD066_02710 [Planctomycetaceae bacterium]
MTAPIDRREFLVSTGAAVAGGWAAVSLAADERPEAPAKGLPFRVSKETTYITEPLRPDGSPDYVAYLDATMSRGITPENNAAVLYLKAIGPGEIPEEKRAAFFAKLGIDPLPAEGKYIDGRFGAPFPDLPDLTPGSDWQRFEKAFDRAGESPWKSADLPAIARLLEHNAEALRLIVEGTKRPEYYLPLFDAPPDAVSPLAGEGFFPHLIGDLRSAVRLLVRQAMLHIGEGRTAEAMDDLLACHLLARHVARRSFLVDRLIGTAFEQIARSGDVALAQQGGLSADELRGFGARLADLPPFPPIIDVYMHGERCFQLDFTIGLSRGGRGMLKGYEFLWDRDTVERVQDLLANTDLDWNASLIRINELHDALADATRIESRAARRVAVGRIDRENEKRMQAARVELERIVDRKAVPARVSKAFTEVVVSDVMMTSSFLTAEDRRDAQFDLARIAVALAAHRAEHGRHPASLADLAPKQIAAIPDDLFREKPQPPVYRPNDDGTGYVLYSVGPNGKDDDARTIGDEPAGDDLVIRNLPSMAVEP